jgi:hypothetical protein
MANYSFLPTSRYYDTPTKTLATADGENLVYLARRFCPPASSFALLRLHQVISGERLDVIDDLTAEIGRRLRITLPAGVPAAPLA